MRKKIINCLIQFKARSNKHNERLRKKRTIDKVVIYYRICDAGYPKVKPTYITKENCLRNAVRCFPLEQVEWHVLGDNICDETYNMILKYIPQNQVKRVSVGHGAGTFRMVYEEALSNSDNTLVYFLEDDYVHVSNSFDCLKAIAKENFADYITLYDHPDKYGYKNQNPFVSGGEYTKLFMTTNHHWKITNSTTMTMAAFVDVLRRDKKTWWRWTAGKHPYDFQIFMDLRFFSRAYLLSPVPSLSTHGETALLAPLRDWEEYL